ncbi:uncharacterized protein [Eleutherodactylus coqui]|uniref:uncharacterized protein n=1 Tax=Eleutherodactylus coqui TaxID=57060 RepID=UPI003461D023
MITGGYATNDAPHVSSRQPSSSRGRSPGRRTAGTSPLAMPEDGRADGAVQRAAPSGGCVGSTLPAFLVGSGRTELLKLVESSVTVGTWKNYNAVWKKWLCCTDGRVAGGERARSATLDMLASLRAGRASVDAAKKHLAGVAFLLKLHGFRDVTKEFVFRQIVRGWKKEKAGSDARRPITYRLLCKLLDTLEVTCSNGYEVLLFRTAFLLAFFAALRIGELVPKSKFMPGGLMFDDVVTVDDGIRVRIKKSKTDVFGRGEWVPISRLGAVWCPVDTVASYMATRPAGEQFLVHASGLPLTRFQVTAGLKSALRSVGLDPKEFGTHSFRIGAATSADAGGMNEDGVKRLGRWKSQAYKSYVRPDLAVRDLS